MSRRPRVILIADWDRAEFADVRARVEAVVLEHADVVGRLPSELPASGSGSPRGDGPDLASDARVDVAVVIGGDGTIIAHLRRLAPEGIPVAGVNVGRLGFLAEFDAERFAECAADVLARRFPEQEHMLLEWSVETRDGRTESGTAVNDGAIASGPPFRMIELGLEIDGMPGPTLAGDGLVVATPTGSTAYSTSAGGPIVHPSVEALVLTPLAAHSLAFRPIVIDAASTVSVEIRRANDGTSFVRDGSVVSALRVADRITFRAADIAARLIVDPEASYWQILQDKLHWAAPPRYRRP